MSTTVLPIFTVYDPETGEMLGTVPQDKPGAAPALIARHRQHQAAAIAAFQARNLDPNEQRLVDEANLALNAPWQVSAEIGQLAAEHLGQHIAKYRDSRYASAQMKAARFGK